MKPHIRGDAGFALVLTLVVTALMVALVVEMVHQVYVDTAISRGFRDSQQASIIAESALASYAGYLARDHADSSYTTTRAPVVLKDEIASLQISVTEESGKININDLVRNNSVEPFYHEVLTRLGNEQKLQWNVWEAVEDWLDIDSEQRSGGAESAYYRTLKPPYISRDNKMMTLTEMSLIKGFAADVPIRLKNFLTIYPELPASPHSPVNINSAPKEVLLSLDRDMDRSMAEAIIEKRQMQPFKATGELSGVAGLHPGILSRLQGSSRITVKGSVFRIVAEARVKEAVRRVEAVVRVAGGVPEYLAWQEY